MVHLYKNNGYNMVLDVNSGSIHVVDDVVYDVLELLNEAEDRRKEEGFRQEITDKMLAKYGEDITAEDMKDVFEDLDELEDTLGVRFWEENGQAHTLWSAALYQEADTIREATDAALELYEIVTGGKDFDRSLWTAASHKSLCAGFNEADPDAIIAWNKRMADLVTMDGIAKAIRDQVPAGSIRKLQSLTKIQKEWLE